MQKLLVILADEVVTFIHYSLWKKTKEKENKTANSREQETEDPVTLDSMSQL